MKPLHFAYFAVALALSSSRVQAASPALDVASNYAGLPSYLNVNRGTGWGTAFTASSSGVNAFLAPAGQIDTGGLSFGLSGGKITRYFGSSQSLQSNQYFSIRLMPGTVSPGGSFGITFINGFSISTALSLGYTQGNPNYVVTSSIFNPTNPTTQTFDTGVAFSTNALMVTLAQSAGTFTLTLTPAGGATTTLTNAYTGNVTGILPYANVNATMYFNEVAVAPEPGSAVALAAGATALGLLARCRRRLA